MLVAGVVLGLLAGPSVLGRFAPQQYDQLFVGSGDTAALDQAQADYAEQMAAFDVTQTEEGRLATEAYTGKLDEIDRRIKDVIEQYKLVGGDDDSTAIARDEQVAKLESLKADELEVFQARMIQAQQSEQNKLKAGIEAAQAEVAARQAIHRDKLLGMATVMLLLIVLLHAAESILSPQRDEIEDGRANLSPVLARLVTVRYGLAAGWLMLMLAQPVWLRGIGNVWVFAVLLLAVILVAGLVPLGKKEK